SLEDVPDVTVLDPIEEILAQEVRRAIVALDRLHGWPAVGTERGVRQAAILAAVVVDHPKANVAADAVCVDEFEADPGVVAEIRERAADTIGLDQLRLEHQSLLDQLDAFRVRRVDERAEIANRAHEQLAPRIHQDVVEAVAVRAGARL